jgi:hypothetical protein
MMRQPLVGLYRHKPESAQGTKPYNRRSKSKIKQLNLDENRTVPSYGRSSGTVGTALTRIKPCHRGAR